VGSFSGNGLGDPVFEAEGNVYQCYSVVNSGASQFTALRRRWY